MNETTKKIDTLLQALEYVKEFDGKVIVIKYGGSVIENKQLQASVFQDISLLSRLGLQIVIVHGGGPAINQALKERGIVSKAIDGLRVTDEQILRVVIESLKRINKDCVKGLIKAGVRAEDYTRNMLIAKQRDPRLGYVGDIVKLNTDVLIKALAYGIVPVVSCWGTDGAGQMYNINADTAAMHVAEALKAEKLTILTNIHGVLDGKGRRLAHIKVRDIPAYIEHDVIYGGMIPKVQACAEAVTHGVKKAHLIDGTIPRALLLEIFTEEGVGTEVVL
jgi:acetylglutamate kinase